MNRTGFGLVKVLKKLAVLGELESMLPPQSDSSPMIPEAGGGLSCKSLGWKGRAGRAGQKHRGQGFKDLEFETFEPCPNTPWDCHICLHGVSGMVIQAHCAARSRCHARIARRHAAFGEEGTLLEIHMLGTSK